MNKTLHELDAALGYLSAQTRARESRIRQLEAINRRLQAEAADLFLCLHEVRSLHGSAPSAEVPAQGHVS